LKARRGRGGGKLGRGEGRLSPGVSVGDDAEDALEVRHVIVAELLDEGLPAGHRHRLQCMCFTVPERYREEDVGMETRRYGNGVMPAGLLGELSVGVAEIFAATNRAKLDERLNN
jgi:hypothetical protein